VLEVNKVFILFKIREFALKVMIGSLEWSIVFQGKDLRVIESTLD
jgi:hypothetical protein